jgi:hypothetical protein
MHSSDKLKRTNIGGRMPFRKASAQLKSLFLLKRDVTSSFIDKRASDKSYRQKSQIPMGKGTKSTLFSVQTLGTTSDIG